MKTNWLILMLLAGVTANAQVYIGSNPNGRPAPGVALEVESSTMGIQFPVINLTAGETLEQKLPESGSALPEGSMVYVKLASNYTNPESFTSNSLMTDYANNGDGYYVKTRRSDNVSMRGSNLSTPSLVWEFTGVVEETFINNQVVNEFLGYPTKRFEDVDTNFLKARVDNFDYKGCKKNVNSGHTYCIFQDRTTSNSSSDISNNYWKNAYDLAKNKGGYLLTITDQAELNYLVNNIFSGSGIVNFETNDRVWLGFTQFNIQEFKDVLSTNGTGNALKYQWITGEDFLMDWEGSVNTGAKVETSQYYQTSSINNSSSSTSANLKSAYWFISSNPTTTISNRIRGEYTKCQLNIFNACSSTNRTNYSRFKYVIVEYSN